MVGYLNLHNTTGVDQVSGQRPIVSAGLGVARGVVVHKISALAPCFMAAFITS
jgi:hypothetical protein